MNIPGDKNDGVWRAEKFVDYAEFVPPVHQNFLVEYAKRRQLDEGQCVFLAFLMGNFYSELTAIFAFEKFGRKVPTNAEVDKFLLEWNDLIVYGTARKWIRYKGCSNLVLNWFVNTVSGDPLGWFDRTIRDKNPREAYDALQTESQRCPWYGRFASDLFNEIVMVFAKKRLITTDMRSDESINFYDGANLTSGLFNILYMDDRANEFDANKKITDEENALLSEKIIWLKRVYELKYPNKEVDVPLFITKICSFRNCFKGKRGGGYHHYRQLKYLREFERVAPEEALLWKEMYEIRKFVYPSVLLGEEHGIVGIPAGLTKWWLKNGWIGNEPEALASIKPNSTLNEFFG